MNATECSKVSQGSARDNDQALHERTFSEEPPAGTFLYVAFMEVIPKELQSPENGLSKLAVLMLGFGLMSLLAVWA